MRVLVTGVAGFIGYHLALRLLSEGHIVIGLDNLNDYYDVQLKKNRVDILQQKSNFEFVFSDIANAKELMSLFQAKKFSHVVNLAAQAGVRYSIINPESYIKSNLIGFSNILEACRHYPVEHLVFASSSSVYGLDVHQPYSPHEGGLHPISLYAATKRSGELIAHSYSHLYSIPSTGLRFFTVYGPWGRPDMALQIFTSAILRNEPIRIFNNGNMKRDFTYIDDIIDGVMAILPLPPDANKNWDAQTADPATSSAPWQIFNIGSSHPYSLLQFIEILEDVMGRKAKKEFLPMQEGDVLSTLADISDLQTLTGFSPKIPLELGISYFWQWFKAYYAAH